MFKNWDKVTENRTVKKNKSSKRQQPLVFLHFLCHPLSVCGPKWTTEPNLIRWSAISDREERFWTWTREHQCPFPYCNLIDAIKMPGQWGQLNTSPEADMLENIFTPGHSTPPAYLNNARCKKLNLTKERRKQWIYTAVVTWVAFTLSVLCF